ncbi:MAG: response regulator transcription factor [Calditrichaceae bacterium]|nr:response regulator transcription factor [Calditrichaceae bacterium]
MDMKVLVVDDHPIFREGLKQILLTDDCIRSVDEAEDGPQAIQLSRKGKYDLIILDISLPGRSGLEVLEDLKKEKPEVPVLILSMYSEDEFAVQAIRGGASGYLNKNGAARELLAAIRQIFAEGLYISPAVAEQLTAEVRGRGNKGLHESLSPRERQIMILIARGKTLTEIADQLSLSVSAVSTYRTRILKKLNLKRNTDIILYAIRHKLVE